MGVAMEIRFTCSACRTVMKLGEAITEQKKVRCSGCGTVIVVAPHPSNPHEVMTSIPNKRERPKGMSETTRRNILMAVVAALIVIMVTAIWWTQAGPSVTAAVEGDVTLDGALAKGWIVFTPVDTSKGAKEVKVAIERGHYSVGAWSGPYIGTNKWQILGNETEIVAPQFNTENQETINIQAGENKKTFETKSK